MKNGIPINITKKIKDCINDEDRENIFYFEVKVKAKRNRQKNKEPIIKELKLFLRKRKEDHIIDPQSGKQNQLLMQKNFLNSASISDAIFGKKKSTKFLQIFSFQKNT